MWSALHVQARRRIINVGSTSSLGLSNGSGTTMSATSSVANARDSINAGCRSTSFVALRHFASAPRVEVPYGVRISAAYKESKSAARKSAVKARKLEEEKGMLLDPRKCLQMELKRNTGISWYRSFQVIKHLEMHKRGKGPPIDARMRDKITQISNVVKAGK